MKAAWYQRQGDAREVLQVGERLDPVPGPGDVRIRVSASGINPGEVKKRSDAFGVGMPYPVVIPHSDGAGVIDGVGPGVAEHLVGTRVWCYGAQSYRPFGTAAEYVVVPVENVSRLPSGVSFVQGACLGIPGITAHRAVHVVGDPAGKTVLVQGGAGAVGSAAVALAKDAGALVLATVRSADQLATALRAGADHVFRTDELDQQALVESVHGIVPNGVDHIVEVAFSANIEVDEKLLSLGGTVATYATLDASAAIPFWQLVFKNVSVHFLGSDDFPRQSKVEAASDITKALENGWSGFEIGAQYPLEEIASAHEAVERKSHRGRVVIDLK